MLRCYGQLLAGILILIAAGLIPSHIELEERELNVAALRVERDRVPYDRWAAEGWADVTVGNARDDLAIAMQLYNVKGAVTDDTEEDLKELRRLVDC